MVEIFLSPSFYLILMNPKYYSLALSLPDVNPVNNLVYYRALLRAISTIFSPNIPGAFLRRQQCCRLSSRHSYSTI